MNGRSNLSPEADPKPPHVVWIMCDQLRADALGFTGNSIVRTPNLDRLAERGVVLDNLFAQSSVCMPSRACMLTGRYPRTLRMNSGNPLLDPRETTVPELLQRAGYRTGMFGKLHLTPQQYTRSDLKTDRPVTDAGPFLEAAGLPPMPQDPVKRNYGFQDVAAFEDALWGEYAEWLEARDPSLPGVRRGESGLWESARSVEFPGTGLQDVGLSPVPADLHPSSFIAESAVDFFERNHAEAPCFMHVSFVDPHHPWDPPAEVARNYPAADMPLPRPSGPGNVTWPPLLEERGADFTNVPDDAARTAVAYYYAMIETIDRGVGKVVDAVERAGELDNTLFVFVADHGELLGSYGLWRKGSYHYDCMIRLPCFISYPRGLPGGRRIGGLVQSLDLPTTLLGLLGMPLHPGMQGEDLSGPLANGDPVGRPHVYCELYTAFWGPFVDCWTVRTDTAKLNYYPSDGVGHLFDLEQDPDELNNVFDATDHRALRDDMTALLLRATCDQKDPLPIPLSQY